MASNGKNAATLVLLLITGIVLGGFLGEYLGETAQLGFLKYGRQFVIGGPGIIDLGVIKLQFGLTVKCTVAEVLGMAFAFFIHKKFKL